MASCQSGYNNRHDFCSRDERSEELVFKMYHESLDLLERRLGDFNTQITDRSPALGDDMLEKYLHSRHGEEDDYVMSYYEVKRRLSSSKNPDIRSEPREGKTFFKANYPKYSFLGQIRLFWIRNNTLCILLGILLIASGAYVHYLNQNISYRKHAETYCRLIEGFISADPQMTRYEDDLKHLLAKEIGKSSGEVNNIWPYIKEEADSRQRIEYAVRYSEGAERAVWFIDRDRRSYR